MGYIPYTIAERKGELIVPTICHFYGIIIVMYLRKQGAQSAARPCNHPGFQCAVFDRDR